MLYLKRVSQSNDMIYMEKKYSSNLITRKVNSPNTTELIEKLSPFVEYKTYATGRRLPFEQHGVRKCYLVRTGAITLHQQPDDILLGMFEAPSIRGVVHGPVGLSHAYLTLRVAAPSEIAIIEYDKLMVLVAEQGLFSLFIGHLQAVTSALFAHNLQLTQPSAYDVVCNQLVSLMNEPALLRDNTTIEKYIRSKTRLSRSGTMRILAELKLGGYIVVENGVLKYIIHLPAKI
jgi:hypothetical protein